MSTTLEFHLGFYLHVQSQPVVTSKRLRVCSSSPGLHTVSGSRSNFCDLCGAPIHEINDESTVMRAYPWALLPNNFENIFFHVSEPGNIWLPNFRVDGNDGKDINQSFSKESDNFVQPIDPEVIGENRAIFLAHPDVQAVLLYVREHYGDDSVEVKYGVVMQYS
jgi:hypothetical protein